MSRVFLHVGAPKTGTTYLQDVLWSNRTALARQGVLYPGEVPGAHFHAAQDLLGRYFKGHKDPRVPGAWDRLARAARGWSGPAVVISHEMLSSGGPEHAERAAASLRPHEVHVLYTARDLGRQVPAMWQESLKNGGVVSYRRYLEALRGERSELAAWGFWLMQDAAEVLRRWQAAAPAERTHVLTVPPRGAQRGLLWDRFCQVIGLLPQALDTTLTPSGSGRNASLGLVEGELLRRINQRLEGQLTWPEQSALLKNFLTHSVLGSLGTGRTGVPASERAWLLERSRALVDGLREADYDIVGSLDELLPDYALETGPDPDTDEVLEAAIGTIAVLLSEHLAARHGLRGGRFRDWARAARARLPIRRRPTRRLSRSGEEGTGRGR